MASGSYIGIDGTARRINNIFIGVDGVARKVAKAYVGVNGIAQLFWNNSEPLPDFLQDFRGYVSGSDDNKNYIITGWKGTLNGEPSTKLIVPDNDTIIL